MGLTGEQTEAIRMLHEEMHHPLYAYALSALKNPSIAEEAVQDVFQTACTDPQSLLTSASPKGWLMEVLKRVILEIRRTQMRLSRIIVSSISLDELEVAAPGTDPTFYLECVDYIGERDFELLKMVYLEGRSMLELSKMLGISVEACKKRVQRSRKKLRTMMERDL